MDYVGGSTEAKSLITSLQRRKVLVNVYTQEWFQSIDKAGYREVEEFEQLKREKPATFIGHLLVMQIDQSDRETKAKLVALYPPLNTLFLNGQHHSDFLLFNLPRNEILGLGLGRKNQLFACMVSADGTCTETSDLHQFKLSAKYDDFICFDHLKIIDDLISALEDLGEGFHRWDSLPLNPGELQELIDAEDETADVSIEEATDLLEEYESADEAIYEASYTISLFFPDLDVNELNTGDY